jgi:alpha-D-ribose 1-methylphosphonate 5-triphosphate diphosphatase PhnM
LLLHIVRGGSQSGNLAASELLKRRLADVAYQSNALAPALSTA